MYQSKNTGIFSEDELFQIIQEMELGVFHKGDLKQEYVTEEMYQSIIDQFDMYINYRGACMLSDIYDPGYRNEQVFNCCEFQEEFEESYVKNLEEGGLTL